MCSPRDTLSMFFMTINSSKSVGNSLEKAISSIKKFKENWTDI